MATERSKQLNEIEACIQRQFRAAVRKPKNVIKGLFCTDVADNFLLLLGEISELQQELEAADSAIDITKAENEAGDCLAYLGAVLLSLAKMRQERVEKERSYEPADDIKDVCL